MMGAGEQRVENQKRRQKARTLKWCQNFASDEALCHPSGVEEFF